MQTIIPVITEPDLITISNHEDALVALLSQGARKEAIEDIRNKLNKYITRRFFNAIPTGNTSWFSALHRIWLNQNNNFAPIQASSVTANRKTIISLRAGNSHLFRAAMHIQSRPTSISMADLTAIATDLVASPRSRPVDTFGNYALEKLSTAITNPESKLRNFVIIYELLTEAALFSPQSERISINFLLSRDGSYATVSDRSVGINPDDLTKLLRTEQYYSHLGLFTAARYAKNNEVEIKSPLYPDDFPFKGASVTVRLND